MNLNSRGTIRTLAVPALVLTLLTATATWPQCLHLATHVSAHPDPLFSMWRLAWVAHAIATDPGHLFDGNIFHPATNTLAYSDAMIFEGVLGAPLFWIGVNPVIIYNLLLLGAMVASGLAMFVLARDLTGRNLPALVSAAVFTVAPYRIEHFMHLELQWAMWVPLAFWALHRAIDRRSWRYGLATGLFLWLQILSSVYYGVFLAIALAALVAFLLVISPKTTLAGLPSIGLGAIVSVALAIPYALPYLETARTLGVRDTAEVATYSATMASYLASPPQSLLWGWTASRFGGAELSLFPGLTTIVLAAAALFHRPRTMTLIYAALTSVAIVLSLGLNGPIYSWLFNHLSALHGLRSPSRFGIVVEATLAVLAGFGTKAMHDHLIARWPRRAAAFVPAMLVFVALDSATTGIWLVAPPYQPASAFNVYKTIRALGPGPVIELPLAKLDALPGREPTYEFWSITHWHPILNGYSGYYPQEFVDTVVRMEHFPDDRSLAQLAYSGVRYVVVHRAFYSADDFRDLMARIALRPELRPHGKFMDPVGECELFVLEP